MDIDLPSVLGVMSPFFWFVDSCGSVLLYPVLLFHCRRLHSCSKLSIPIVIVMLHSFYSNILLWVQDFVHTMARSELAVLRTVNWKPY
jgi:hypothetical protein